MCFTGNPDLKREDATEVALVLASLTADGAQVTSVAARLEAFRACASDPSASDTVREARLGAAPLPVPKTAARHRESASDLWYEDVMEAVTDATSAASDVQSMAA